jgi:lysophospholipase L1-like esterase
MMIHDDLEFHNVAELVAVEGLEGLRLQRIPESLRSEVDEGTGGVMLSPANSEIRFRFKPGCDDATITLASEEGAVGYVYHGPFQGQSVEIGPEPTDVLIKDHKRQKLLTLEQKAGYSFNPDLIRICFGSDYPEPVTYIGHNGNVCLPKEGDSPSQTLLAYGTSITHGTGLSGAALSYSSHAAWKLGMDHRNLGASGCCLCESAMAHFLAAQDCDLMTLELSVNMLGRGINAEEFREKAGYLVKTVAEANPDRPIVCITLLPHYNDMGQHLIGDNQNATSEEYRQVLRDIVSSLNLKNLTLVEGPELLGNIEGLSRDLIHPGARGMIEIGENLASKIASLVG